MIRLRWFERERAGKWFAFSLVSGQSSKFLPGFQMKVVPRRMIWQSRRMRMLIIHSTDHIIWAALASPLMSSNWFRRNHRHAALPRQPSSLSKANGPWTAHWFALGFACRIELHLPHRLAWGRSKSLLIASCLLLTFLCLARSDLRSSSAFLLSDDLARSVLIV